jgi:hypothetical protein
VRASTAATSERCLVHRPTVAWSISLLSSRSDLNSFTPLTAPTVEQRHRPSRRFAYLLSVLALALFLLPALALAFFAVFKLGDRLPERITAVVSQPGDDIIFDLPASEKPPITVLIDIIVSRVPDLKDVSEQEVFWHVRMDRRVFTDNPIIRWPVRYGETVANAALIVPAKKLRTGRYRFDAGVSFANSDGSMQNDPAKVLLLEFLIDDQLRLRP